jgi:hypothetical protein
MWPTNDGELAGGASIASKRRLMMELNKRALVYAVLDAITFGQAE